MRKRRKSRPLVRANFYSIEKIIYKKRKYLYISNPKGYLYSGASILVKVTKDDLPPYFVPVRYKKCYGFIRTNKVKSLIYLPANGNNHFLKDDVLLISYNGKIEKDSNDLFGYRNYQLYIYGVDILTFLKGANEYSKDLDTSLIENQIRNKKTFLKEYREDVYHLEAEHINLDLFLPRRVLEAAY